MKQVALIFAILILSVAWSVAQEGPQVDGEDRKSVV